MSSSLGATISNSYPYEEQKSNLVDASIKTIGLLGSGADHVVTANQDIGAVITSLLSDDTTIEIFSGKYVLSTAIDFRYKSRCELKGQGFQRTRIFCTAGTSAINMENAAGQAEDYENSVHDISFYHGSFPGSTTSNAGTYFLKVGRNKTCMFYNIFTRYFETGIYLSNDVFYCSFFNVVCDDMSDYAVRISYGDDDRCNSNYFSHCKFKGGTGTGLVGTPSATVDAPEYTVYIERGNQNIFNSCVFENWKQYGIYFADDALCQNNQVFGGRMESNYWLLAAQAAIYFGASSLRNYICNVYMSGSDIPSNTGTYNLNSSNNWIEDPSYLGETIYKCRSLLSAGDFITYERTGSGNAKALLKLIDSYANSGTPNTLHIDCKRAASNLIYGTNDSTQVLRATAAGILYLGTEDVNDGQLHLYGDAANTSGVIRIYNSANYDTTNDYFQLFGNSSGNFSIGYDGNTEILSLTNAGNLAIDGTLTANSSVLSSTEIDYLTSITAGTAAASKAVVLDASKNITGLNNITTDGDITLFSGNISCTGYLDVNSAAKCSIENTNDSLADAVLEIKQGDTDEAFIDFVGTSGVTAGTSITTLTAGNNRQGHIKINVNGADYWIPYYDTPTT